MNKVKLWLGALLITQLALASALLLGDRWRGDDQQPAALVASEAAQVDRIVISDAGGQALLSREAGNWMLPELDSLPAQSENAEELLTRLASMQTQRPVTATEASHERFEVAEEGFQRRVQLFNGERTVADFFLGTSPGFRQVHLRRNAEQEVYAIELNVHDLPARDEEWLDKSLLAISSPVRIAAADYTLRDSGTGDWLLEKPAEGDGHDAAELDLEKARRLVNALANIRVQSVADEQVPLEDFSGALHSLQVDTAEDSLTFTFKATGDEHYVRRDDTDTLFVLSQYDYDRIAPIGLEDLIVSSPAEPETQDQSPPTHTPD